MRPVSCYQISDSNSVKDKKYRVKVTARRSALLPGLMFFLVKRLFIYRIYPLPSAVPIPPAFNAFEAIFLTVFSRCSGGILVPLVSIAEHPERLNFLPL